MDTLDYKRITDAELIALSALLNARVAARTSHNVACARNGGTRYTAREFVNDDRIYRAIEAELSFRDVLR